MPVGRCFRHWAQAVPATSGGRVTVSPYDFRPRVVMVYGSSYCGSLDPAFFGFAYFSAAGFGWQTTAGPDEATCVGSGEEFFFGIEDGSSYIGNGNFSVQSGAANIKAPDLYDLKTQCAPSKGWSWAEGPAGWGGMFMGGLSLGGTQLRSFGGSFNLGAPGTITVTGVGFQPQVLLFLWQKAPTYNVGTFDYAGAGFGFGAASSSSAANQFSHFQKSDYLGGAGSSAGSVHQNDYCIVTHYDSATINARCQLASLDPDGFTLTQTGNADSRLIGFLALSDAGGQFHVGQGTQRTTLGTQSFTAPGFTPDILMFGHGNVNTSGTVYNGFGGWHIGACDVDSQASMISGYWFGNRLAASAVSWATGLGAPVVAGEAVLSSLDTNGFTLNYTTTDGVARPFGYIAMKPGSGGCDSPPCQAPGIYRRTYKYG